jgi:hypothetical protein
MHKNGNRCNYLQAIHPSSVGEDVMWILPTSLCRKHLTYYFQLVYRVEITLNLSGGIPSLRTSDSECGVTKD